MRSPLAAASEIADRCAAIADEHGSLGREFKWMHEAGLLSVVLPRAQGGLGWGSEPGTWEPLLRLLKIAGRGNLSVGRIFEGHVNALQLILQWGSPEQVAAAALEVNRGRVFGVWNTEAPGDGLSLEEADGGRWRLRGAKTFASGASLVTRVFANALEPGGGWQMCLVPIDAMEVTRDARLVAAYRHAGDREHPG